MSCQLILLDLIILVIFGEESTEPFVKGTDGQVLLWYGRRQKPRTIASLLFVEMGDKTQEP
jgi:hypothetical protein